MGASRHLFPGFLARWIDGARQRYRRRMGERIMSELPPELQRDIGWKPSVRLRQ